MKDYQQEQQQKLQLAKAVIKEAAAVVMEAPEALAVQSQKLQNMLRHARQGADIVNVNDDPMDEAEPVGMSSFVCYASFVSAVFEFCRMGVFCMIEIRGGAWLLMTC